MAPKVTADDPTLQKEAEQLNQYLGIKITYLRKTASGTVGDRDVYGAQQHAPLMTIDIP